MNPLYFSVYHRLPAVVQKSVSALIGRQRGQTQLSAAFQSRLEAWEHVVSAPLELQKAQQWQELRQLIERARTHVPYYRSLPEPVDSHDPAEAIELTLKGISPLEKSEYRARSNEFLAADIPSHQRVRKSTSGTTGSALPVWLTREQIDSYALGVWRQRRAFGAELGDPWIQFTGKMIAPLQRKSPPFWLTDHASHRKVFSSLHISPETLDCYIDEIHRTPARYVQGYPSALHLVSLAMHESGRCLPPGTLCAVFTSSESLSPVQRSSIEEAFGASVREHYGSTERVASMTACEQNQLHVDMNVGIVEVEVEVETPDYVQGPLLLTHLGHPAAPLIRYRIGDIGTRSKHPCPCGRPGDVFLEIDGRIEDYVVTPDGRIVGRLDHVFKSLYEIAEAQIVQDEHGAIEVSLVPSKGFGQPARQRLMRALRSRLGDDLPISLKLVEAIPREANGKFRAVKSHLAVARALDQAIRP